MLAIQTHGARNHLVHHTSHSLDCDTNTIRRITQARDMVPTAYYDGADIAMTLS